MINPRHPALHDYGEHYVRPRQIINALHDAAEEMSFSNYHGSMFAKAEAIIRLWCKAQEIPLGPTKAAIEKREQEWHKRWHADMQSGDMKRIGLAIRRLRKRNR